MDVCDYLHACFQARAHDEHFAKPGNDFLNRRLDVRILPDLFSITYRPKGHISVTVRLTVVPDIITFKLLLKCDSYGGSWKPRTD